MCPRKCTYFIGLVKFLLVHYSDSLYDLDMSPLSDKCITNIFFSMDHPFIFLIMLFEDKKLLMLVKTVICLFISQTMLFISYLINFCLPQGYKGLLLNFLFSCRSVVHSELNFVYIVILD